MSFTLDGRSPVPDAVRDVALERLDRVIGELSGERSDDPAEAVHAARKDLKRLRSLVRLLRPGLRRKVYRREADALREVSRALGARRDADALVETVDRLRDRAAGRVPATTLDALTEVLARRAEEQALAADGATATAGAFPDELAALRAIRERVAAGALAVDGSTTLAEGLARSYARATDAFAATQDDPTADELHEWRKRVKDLWYQQALLAPAWPAVVGAQRDEAKALSKLLGDDHDLAALTEVVADPDGPVGAVPADTDALLPLIASRRAELLVGTRAYGARLHAERPKAFRRRVRRYLDAPPLPA
jgi:CHAD domain-containing protein